MGIAVWIVSVGQLKLPCIVVQDPWVAPFRIFRQISQECVPLVVPSCVIVAMVWPCRTVVFLPDSSPTAIASVGYCCWYVVPTWRPGPLPSFGVNTLCQARARVQYTSTLYRKSGDACDSVGAITGGIKLSLEVKTCFACKKCI